MCPFFFPLILPRLSAHDAMFALQLTWYQKLGGRKPEKLAQPGLNSDQDHKTFAWTKNDPMQQTPETHGYHWSILEYAWEFCALNFPTVGILQQCIRFFLIRNISKLWPRRAWFLRFNIRIPSSVKKLNFSVVEPTNFETDYQYVR